MVFLSLLLWYTKPMSLKNHPYLYKTRRAILFSSILHEPFSAFFPILPFILLKDLNATAFQIVLLTMLKPLSSIFSFYWSELVSQKRHSLKINLLGAGLIARLGFIMVLFTDNVWLYIAASSVYMLFMRASIPAWMEILRRNLPNKLRERYFALGSAIGYGEGVLIAIAFGWLLDQYFGIWRYLLLASLCIGILGVIVQAMLPMRERSVAVKEKAPSLKKAIVQPWQDCTKLMKTNRDFRNFQWAFMLGGFGLMIIQPVIPIFFSEVLRLSYLDLMVAYSICKGLGFVASSGLWSRFLSIGTVGRFNATVLLGFAIFPMLLILGVRGDLWIYLAFLVYGIAQAGSHLIWHLSGPLFAKEENSARYSGVNIVMVGVRGLIGPPLGGLLAMLLGPISVFMFSIVFGLVAAEYSLRAFAKSRLEPSN